MQIFSELGESEARLAIDACLETLRLRGKAAIVAVADRSGELIALWRMDGALLPSVLIAVNKAYTSARLHQPSGEMGRAANKEEWDVYFHGNSQYVGWDGGVAVMKDGVCLGAVAVSGLSGAEDLEVAQIGVNAILTPLE